MGDARERVGDPEQKLDDAEQDDCPLCLHRDRRDEEEDHPIGEQHAESEEDAEDAAAGTLTCFRYMVHFLRELELSRLRPRHQKWPPSSPPPTRLPLWYPR